MSEGGGPLAIVIYLLVMAALSVIIVVLCVLPAIIAFRRRAQNRWFILLLNLLLGSTGVGWVAALIWAYRAKTVTAQPIVGSANEAGVNLLISDIRRLPMFPQPTPASVDLPASPTSAAETIERLITLHSQGYLTDEEFAKLKAEALRKL